MRTIYKYYIDISDEVTINLPIGAEIIKFDKDSIGNFCIWCIVDDTQELQAKKFAIRGTGNPIESNLWYIGTAVSNPFVWHLFEVI
jgi:hypothetical protein